MRFFACNRPLIYKVRPPVFNTRPALSLNKIIGQRRAEKETSTRGYPEVDTTTQSCQTRGQGSGSRASVEIVLIGRKS